MFDVTLEYPSEVVSKSGERTALRAFGYWTSNGEPMPGKRFAAPPGANDFHLKVRLLGVQFTKDGKPIGPLHPTPQGANDVHIRLAAEEPEGPVTSLVAALEAEGGTEEASRIAAALRDALAEQGCL